MIGWLEGNSGPPNLTDRFIIERSANGVIADAEQNVQPTYAHYGAGIMTFEFQRFRNTGVSEGKRKNTTFGVHFSGFNSDMIDMDG